MRFFVNGTLMRGLELEANLHGADFLGERVTAPRYRLHTIGDSYPGMYEVGAGGVAVHGELYELSAEHCGRVMASEPPGLYLGQIVLDSGEVVNGVLCRQEVASDHPDISEFGGWRAYMESRVTS